MDGENNGKPENPIKMDDLGVPLFLETPMLNQHSLFDALLMVQKSSNHHLGCIEHCNGMNFQSTG